MALTPLAKTYDYPTTVSEVREGMTVRLPLFPARMVEVERIYTMADNTYFMRFNNGNVGGSYKGTDPITVVSDN